MIITQDFWMALTIVYLGLVAIIRYAWLSVEEWHDFIDNNNKTSRRNAIIHFGLFVFLLLLILNLPIKG